VEGTTTADETALTDQQVRVLATETIFFGHQSVGNNIIQGIKDLMVADPRLRLNIIRSTDPIQVPRPAFIDGEIGENTKPNSKNQAFLAILKSGFGVQGGIAMFKYCYVDIGSSSDVHQMFGNYQNVIETVRSKYPSLKIVHVTVPLTTVEPSFKAWLKTILGRSTAREANVKRNEFNKLLKQAFVADPIFDLAEVESTHPNGQRSFFMLGNEIVYTLVPEYTNDGGHLNETGRRAAAERLLLTLAQL
jgi:hypothetical protein